MNKGLFTIIPSNGSNNDKISVTCKKDINNENEVTEIISIGDSNIQKTVTLNRKAPIKSTIILESDSVSVVKQYPTIKFGLVSMDYPREDTFKISHINNTGNLVEEYITNGTYYTCDETERMILKYVLFTNSTYKLLFEFYNRLPATVSDDGDGLINFENIMFRETNTIVHNNVPDSEKLIFYKSVLRRIKEKFNQYPNKNYKIKSVNIRLAGTSALALKSELESYSVPNKFSVIVSSI